ncbi:uncharacterized protein LOC105726707 [Aotus nancymaae]|uniref:uncharacterized protein LOC105726707 n=1 Tax=Aotus nancymaae TaxID=37293 RepID=UPI0030FEED11
MTHLPQVFQSAEITGLSHHTWPSAVILKDVDTLVAGPEQVFWTTDTLPRRPPKTAPPHARDSAPPVSSAAGTGAQKAFVSPPPTQVPAGLGKSPPSLQVRGPPRFPESSRAAGTYLRPLASGRGRATACPPTSRTARYAPSTVAKWTHSSGEPRPRPLSPPSSLLLPPSLSPASARTSGPASPTAPSASRLPSHALSQRREPGEA